MKTKRHGQLLTLLLTAFFITSATRAEDLPPDLADMGDGRTSEILDDAAAALANQDKGRHPLPPNLFRQLEKVEERDVIEAFNASGGVPFEDDQGNYTLVRKKSDSLTSWSNGNDSIPKNETVQLFHPNTTEAKFLFIYHGLMPGVSKLSIWRWQKSSVSLVFSAYGNPNALSALDQEEQILFRSWTGEHMSQFSYDKPTRKFVPGYLIRISPEVPRAPGSATHISPPRPVLTAEIVSLHNSPSDNPKYNLADYFAGSRGWVLGFRSDRAYVLFPLKKAGETEFPEFNEQNDFSRFFPVWHLAGWMKKSAIILQTADTPGRSHESTNPPMDDASKNRAVTARSGLILRSGPGPAEPKLATIPHGTIVSVIEYSKNETQIETLKARWAHVTVRLDNHSLTGWCFGAFLTKPESTMIGRLVDHDERGDYWTFTVREMGANGKVRFIHTDEKLLERLEKLNGQIVSVQWSENEFENAGDGSHFKAGLATSVEAVQ